MDFFNNSIELISDYITQASQEYSSFERTRHKHFTYEGLEGSHKKAIKYWLEVLDKGVHSFNEEIQATGEEIIKRATEDIQSFYKNISNDEDRQFFIQLLMKHEKKLLNLDKERYKKYKNASVEADDFQLPKPNKQNHETIADRKKAEEAKPAPQKEAKIKSIPSEDEIKSIRAKGKISVRDFEFLYGYGKTWQQQKRDRSKDKLPYHKVNGLNSKIQYFIEEVDEWFRNQVK